MVDIFVFLDNSATDHKFKFVSFMKYNSSDFMILMTPNRNDKKHYLRQVKRKVIDLSVFNFRSYSRPSRRLHPPTNN